MTRRSVITFGLAGTAAAQTAAQLQRAGNVNGPRCIICGTTLLDVLGYVVTSAASTALDPMTDSRRLAVCVNGHVTVVGG